MLKFNIVKNKVLQAVELGYYGDVKFYMCFVLHIPNLSCCKNGQYILIYKFCCILIKDIKPDFY